MNAPTQLTPAAELDALAARIAELQHRHESLRLSWAMLPDGEAATAAFEEFTQIQTQLLEALQVYFRRVEEMRARVRRTRNGG